ncbi:hypothetical protein [Streptococcus canis]|uniref:Uncharacterized protein n=1 Tax=Streptococcus canis FSL Z3-227 TaxID=482234 RepID=A0AAV3FUD7_STRCB|nr:hypothetical protein [Streptococcus canis]EIQ82686.1 hypothetical protein SCAZ3_10005 [Streptococcus canis FSL Z3-227]
MTEDTKIEMKDKIDWLGLFVNGLVYLIKGLIFLVSTPIFLGMWLLNFLKSILGTVIMWCLGKFVMVLIFGGVLTLISYINESWLSQEKIDTLAEGFSYHILGKASYSGYPLDAWGMFSYPTIEITLIIILAVVTATMMTIDPDRI